MATARAVFRSWRTTSMTSVSARLTGLFGSVALLHVAGWGIMLLLVAPRFPVMLGLGGLAYAYGLRHAFDADHISAIDNTTRKLLQQGKRPLGVGFFFSLGHSTVVFVLTIAIAGAAAAITRELPQLQNVGGVIGAGVAGLFLWITGILNLLVLLDLLSVWRQAKSGAHSHSRVEALLAQRGLLNRLFR